MVATAGDDGTVVWDAGTGAMITRVARGSDSWSVQFTRDAARIVTCSDNGFAEIWDARSGQRAGPAFPTTRAGPAGQAAPAAQFDVRIDAFGSRLVLTHPAGVTLFDAATGATIKELDVPQLESQRMPAAFAPAGDVLVTVNSLVQLWDAGTGHLLATLRKPSPLDAQFTADGNRLVTTHDGGFRFLGCANRTAARRGSSRSASMAGSRRWRPMACMPSRSRATASCAPGTFRSVRSRTAPRLRNCSS